MSYYPIVLDLTERRCLVVGGGEVAARKVRSLVDAGARVTVIAPEIAPEIEAMPGVELFGREYASGDIAGYALVFAATGDRDVNAAVSADASLAGALVNVVDDPQLCSFIVPASVRRGELMICVTSSGSSPSLSKKIRNEIEERYGEEYGELARLLGEMRDIVKLKYTDPKDREAAFGRLLDGEILALLGEGRTHEAVQKALECI